MLDNISIDKKDDSLYVAICFPHILNTLDMFAPSHWFNIYTFGAHIYPKMMKNHAQYDKKQI